LNWQGSDLAARLRSDPGKLAIAARLRNETTLPIKWIAALVQIGTPKGAQAVLKGNSDRRFELKLSARCLPWNCLGRAYAGANAERLKS
jgi:hypothetical protein